MFKVVVTDYTFASLDIEAGVLGPLDCEIVGVQCKVPGQLLPRVSDADAVLTQFARIDAEVIAAMRKARVIVRYGIGVDNVDLEAACQRGIPVCNVPDYCIDEVADHTLAFLLAATRQVVANCMHVRRGGWSLAVPLAQMRTLRDLTVGIVGFGRMGRAVAARLAPFQCRRLVHDPQVAPDAVRQSGCEPVDLALLLTESNAVTLHCPSTPQTRRLINAESLRGMKPGTVLVNLARGDLVDTTALSAALQSGHLGAAALDVYDPEPIPPDSPLLQMENVVVSAHVASASVKAVTTLRETAAQIVALALRGEPLPNVVNGVAGAQ
jgi:D-3-phosphoglycerate dehydrogenase